MDDDSTPVPPRYWWLKRISIGVAALLVFLIALRLWWGWEANRRLQAEIARIVAAGEPIFPEDFNPKEPIPDEENAAKFYRRAAEAMQLTIEQQSLCETLSDNLELLNEPTDEVRKLFADTNEAVRLYHEGARRREVDWGGKFVSPAYMNFPVDYTPQRALSKLLRLSAYFDSTVGERARAVDKLDDMLRHACSLREHPFLISHLVSWAIGALALAEIEKLVFPPQLGADLVTSGRRAEEWSAAVRRLILSLTVEDNLHRTFQRAMLAERMMQLDIIESMRLGTTSMNALYGWQAGVQASIPDFVWTTVLWPAIKLDGVRLMKEADRRATAIETLDVSYLPNRSDDDGQQRFLDHIAYPLSKDSWASLDRAGVLFVRLLTMHRLTATGVAIRLYRFEHGQLPPTLEDLVPEYLSELPTDPMSREARFFVYRPDDAPPILYSVGANGIDDDGSFEIEAGVTRQETTPDIPFFVDGDRPLMMKPDRRSHEASGETSDDDEDEYEEDGDAKTRD